MRTAERHRPGRGPVYTPCRQSPGRDGATLTTMSTDAIDDGAPRGVGPVQAQALLADGALLLDVREDFEWEAGHVPSARHVPLGQLPARLVELDRQQQLVVTCRAGHRSARAVAFLTNNGFAAVNLEGGMQAWAGAGLPFARANGSPGTVA